MADQILRRPAPPALQRLPLPTPPPAVLRAAAITPLPASRTWPLYAFTLCGWCVVVLLHAFALHRDALGRDGAAGLADIVLSVVPPVLPLSLASCALAYAFARSANTLLLPRRLVLLGVGFIAMALLGAGASTVLANMLHEGAPLAGFFERLLRHDGFGWWVNTCLATLAFLSQAAVAAWRRGRQQALAAEQAHTDSLTLRLRLLQGQLKPHFLFNALNSISALVRTAERELAAQSLGQLSELLRHVVHASRHSWLSVSDEMAFIEAYLDMQLLRYGERLTIELDIGAGPWDALACPPLLFQPLVENAIHHGVEQHHRQCCLRMRLWLEAGVIRFSVDNPLAPRARAKAGHGMGHTATRERLAILYGDQARMDSADDGAIYTATLAFPARPFDAP